MAWETRTLDEFKEKLTIAKGEPTEIFAILVQFAETFMDMSYSNSDRLIEFLHELESTYLGEIL